MKAFLMFADRDFDPKARPPAHAPILTQDLEIETPVAAMAQDDALVADVSRFALLTGPANERATILYRQDILRDCLLQPRMARDIYALAGRAIEAEKKHYRIFFRSATETLRRSIEVMRMFMTMLTDLRVIARQNATAVRSAGLKTVFETLERELSDAYFAEVTSRLDTMIFNRGILLSAALGDGNKGIDYTLRQPTEGDKSWWTQLFGPTPETYMLTLDPRDEAGARALSELNDRGLTLIADAMARSVEHLLSFFAMLRTELAFYVGALNLRSRLAEFDQPCCVPEVAEGEQASLHFRDLHDVCLALRKGREVVGSDLDADGKDLIVITGANQGGKSTFLRSLGLAQLMMQSGMVVPAASFSGSLFTGVFTHYRREEDRTMRSGKFDEELSRMSGIVDAIDGRSLVLFNESFASTNEREGSEVARQIVRGLLGQSMTVVFVTHMYDLAHAFAVQAKPDHLFLRAERREGGERSFRLSEGEPLATSYGVDLYRRIFEDEKRHVRTAA